MSGSGGFGQLVKGVFIGIILILAIVGTMTILDKGDDETSDTPAVSTSSPISASPEIKAPDISIASQPSESENQASNAEDKKPKTDGFKPSLEGERTAEDIKKEAEEKQAAAIKFGQLKLSTINPSDLKSLMADYTVYDKNNIKVAESKRSSGALFKLPVGAYKVVTVLTQATNNKSEKIEATQNILISADKVSNKIFELEPPSTIGVLQVSATLAKSKKSVKANFIVQKENGETIATRQNVANSLFQLKAGSYKVTVKSGDNSDFRTVVIKAGESANEVFKLKQAFSQGKLLVRIFDTRSNKPVEADILITTRSGKKIQALTAISQTEIALAAGSYKVKATASSGESSKNIVITAGKSSSEVFRFDAPKPSQEETQITDNVTITPVETEKKPQATEVVEPIKKAADETDTANAPSLGFVKLFARNEIDQKPLKSNFYVQTQNGKNVAKKIYADNAEFKLKPGSYKITIRSKNRKNIVKNIEVFAGRASTEIFQLQKNTPATPKSQPNHQTTAQQAPVLAPAKPSLSPAVIPNGFLNVAMQPARNTHFIITNKAGKKIVELTSVPSGNFKLDTGVYVVTAIFNNQRRKQTVQVRQGKTAHINFNAANFQAPQRARNSRPKNAPPKGVLRSRIVDNTGRPLKGNLTVTNMQGQVVARANGVTVGLFDLPPAPHNIIVNYQGLRGSERVNISAGQTTVQTFTISPNGRPPAQAPAPAARQARDPKEMIRDKIEEELRRIF